MSDQEKRRILIVEDDETIAESIRELLEDNNYEVVNAHNGAEALKILRIEKRPNLILLDLMMPVLDGFGFRTEQLQDPALRDIPVVVMSADDHVEQKRVRTSAAEYLRKPVDIMHLLATVAKHSGG